MNGSGSVSICSAEERGYLPDAAHSTATVAKEGWLQKWTNYLKGYRQRWFVLDSQGILSYYRNKTEVGVACRGSVNLQESRIHSDPATNSLIISGTSQNFHLKANNEVDRGNWLSALEYARHDAVKRADFDEEEGLAITDTGGIGQILDETKASLNKKLDELRHAESQIKKISHDIAKSLEEHNNNKHIGEKFKHLKTQIGLVIRTAEALVEITKKETGAMSRIATNEHDQRVRLQEQLETLAKQHSSLERAAFYSASSLNGDQPPPYHVESEDETFHDAPEELDGERREAADDYELTILNDRSGESSSRHDSLAGDDTDSSSSRPYHGSDSMSRDVITGFQPPSNPNAIRERRRRVPDRPVNSINLWSFMRNCIGKELTKIPMPVNFNEPLSFLQRITEDLEYADLLDRAADLSDPCEQMCYVAAYATSCYSTTGHRTTKPFNPLLGETFECDRIADRGWWSLTEQVSHHPPSSAHHAEGRKWIMYQDFTMTSRFRGKYLSVTPTGYTHVKFKNTGHHYTYKKVTTTVHNIIVGKLWIDNHGEIVIQNHSTGDQCTLKFHAYSYFSQDKAKRVSGLVKDSRGAAKRVLQGHWDQEMEMAKVTRHEGTSLETGPFQRIWTVNPPFENSEKMYRFTQLAVELNEDEQGVAPTDSRKRPDQRLMEDGRWDEANKLKEQLEDRQRTVRRQREAEAEQAMRQGLAYPEYRALWFEKGQDDCTGSVVHLFTGDYWKCKERKEWSRCPQIF